ncbi:uncharacterized protein BXIN_1555 [Babesia sp. Xinjiang]|uniref:uncharacterized protein n=1 Tax=Babesia sp. Xinjiang TaxID=462227 RepID=UPI000A261050|nr:uncharacterized protein BXIN_1555 [Babesia sp. Xinjiang]ORM42311.1 hypothetical protein BXIN_1555 [Babesia sp. Xinjiang]
MGENGRRLHVYDVATAERSCALVFNGGEGHAVAHAMSLLGVLLNCVDELKDKYGLLICKRSSWDAAVTILDHSLYDSFGACGYHREFSQGLSVVAEDVQDTLEAIFRHAFGVEDALIQTPSRSRIRGSLADDISNDLCSQMSNASLHTEGAVSGQEQVPTNFSRTTPTPANTNGSDYCSMQNMITMDRSREMNLERLIVRFVEDTPMESLGEKRSADFNTFVEPGLEMKWNYIQAANEICIHPPSVAVTVVADLAYMQFHRKRREECVQRLHCNSNSANSGVDTSSEDTYHSPTHPFDTGSMITWEEGGFRLTWLRSYTFSVALTLNALNANLVQSQPETTKLPKLFLMERLPATVCSQRKFMSFLRSRFQFLYRLE